MMLEEVRKAADALAGGGIILYPTDTLWGIGCDATDPDPVEKIYRIKERPHRKGILVLMENPEMLGEYLHHVPRKALEIINDAEKPTTIIFPGARSLAPNLLEEDGSVGIRIPADPFCLQLIKRTGKPIVSTSANKSGNRPPAIFREIERNIVECMDYVVNLRQEETDPASPSSIIRLESNGMITILRP
jgi:L-threonylcarbamoyladenylate synthase